MCLQDKIKLLEIELDEEKSSVELLNDRITRSRDQVPHEGISHSDIMQIKRRRRFYAAVELITGSLTPPPHSPLRWISFARS